MADICFHFKFSHELPQVANFTVRWLAMVVRKHLSVVSQNELLLFLHLLFLIFGSSAGLEQQRIS